MNIGVEFCTRVVYFLNYLHGSEPSNFMAPFLSSFLNYLHGSELNTAERRARAFFLNYLHGSERVV